MQYNRLFIDYWLQYKKNTISEHVVYKNCFECQNKNKKQFLYATYSELVFFWVRSRKSMNNLLSYCGLTDARMNPPEKDLPVSLVVFTLAAFNCFHFILKNLNYWKVSFEFFFCTLSVLSSSFSCTCSVHLPLEAESHLRTTTSRSSLHKEATWGTSIKTGPRNLDPRGPTCSIRLARPTTATFFVRLKHCLTKCFSGPPKNL